MLHVPQPVLADLGAVIQAIILIVFLASGAVKMFRESKDAQQRAEQRQRHQRRPQPQGDGGAGARPAEAAAERQQPQEAIRSEVEEFLRRAGEAVDKPRPERQAAGGPGPRRAPTRQPSIELLDDDSGIELDERPRASHRRKPPVESQLPQVTLQNLGSQGIERGETVAAHVAEHLKRGAFEERASHLGEEVALADDRLEARLHEKFDHGLGSLSARRRAREAADEQQRGEREAPTPADGLLELLSTPQGVQTAVVLNEVLNRPFDRW